MRLRTAIVPLLAAFAATAQAHPHQDGVNFRGTCMRQWPGDGYVTGSGNLVRQARAAGTFNRITADGPAHLQIAIGPRPSIEVEADDNIVGFITTDSRGGRLKIGAEGSFCMARAPKLRITVPSLAAIDMRASGDAEVTGLNGGNLDVTITGSSDVMTSGRLDRLGVTINGSGDVDLNSLQARFVDATVNGSGEVDLGTSHLVSATVNGSGTIYYSGNPEFVDQAVRGSGRIRRR